MRRKIITAIILTVPVVFIVGFILSNFEFTPPWQPKSAEEYAKKYELKYFSGIGLNEEDPNKVDIYGTIREVNVRSLKLALVVPGYLIDYAESQYYIPQDSNPKILTINLDGDSRFYDPYDNNKPKRVGDITKGNKRIVDIFSNAYIHITANVDVKGSLTAKEVAIATLSIDQ